MGANDVADRVTEQHIPNGIANFGYIGLFFLIPHPVVVGTCKKKQKGKIRGVKKSPMPLLNALGTFSFFKFRIQIFEFLHFYDLQIKESEISIY